MRFSANLGFLFREFPLPDAIRAAKAAGYETVECHWPYDVPAQAVTEAIRETGLPMLCINTVKGDTDAGDSGLSALPERVDEARAAIDQAVDYAARIGCRNVHVMAGLAEGGLALDCFVANLKYASARAVSKGVCILIEPLNSQDVPGYLLHSTDLAVKIIGTVGADNLKIMYDIYHMQIMQGDHLHTLETLMPYIGHIQIASVPGRKTPDRGKPDYSRLLPEIEALGYQGYFGAEYFPDAPETHDWLQSFRQVRL